MKEVILTLTVDEASAILQVLGNLPTSSGAWVLLQKIKAQVEASVLQEQKE